MVRANVEAQVKAADTFRELYEAMGGSGVGAMDYGQVQVDGGGAREALSEAQIAAGQALDGVHRKLGDRNYDLVSRICGQGLSLGEVSPVRRDRDTAADNLRAALDDLATMWGIAVRSGPGSVVNKQKPPAPGPASSPSSDRIRGDLSEPVRHDAGAPVDTAWAESQNERQREAKRAKAAVNGQRANGRKSSSQR